MTAPRQPNQSDLLALAAALSAFQVEYVIIGGAAMALHGFPRMTKDIDLLLPVDPANNARLLRALESMPESKDALAALRPEWMDKGFSTTLEGDITLDLLYVAASRSFDDLREHVQTVTYNGVPVVTLDVDGMLLTKKTTRESDLPDRLKLGRLRNAQRDLASQLKRIEALPGLESAGGAVYTFWRLAKEAIKVAGNARCVDWREVEDATIRESIGLHGQSVESVSNALCEHSPGAVSSAQQNDAIKRVQEQAPRLQLEFNEAREKKSGRPQI